MLETDGGYLAPAEQLASHDAAVPGDDLALRVNQHRHVEAEGLDTARDLAYLPGAMDARIFWVESQLGERPIDPLSRASPHLGVAQEALLAIVSASTQPLPTRLTFSSSVR